MSKSSSSQPLPPSRVAPQFVVRLPDEEFRQRIADAAIDSNRSMNSEIVARLQASFIPAPSPIGAAVQELADSRAQTIRALAAIQRTLCANVVRLFATLETKKQTDRGFREAAGLADSLLEGTKPDDFLDPSPELVEALGRLREALDAQTKNDARRVISQRPQRSNSVKR